MEARPWLVAFGIVALMSSPLHAAEVTATPLSGVDTSRHPGAGFYDYANGLWMAQAKVSPDHDETGALQTAIDGMDERMRVLLQAAASAPGDSNEAKVGAYYRAFSDDATRDRLGMAPLAPLMRAIATAPDHAALAKLMGREQIDFTGSIVDIYVNVDHADGHRYAVFLTQAGLGLPDRDYYAAAAFAPQRRAYLRYLRFMLGAAGVPDPAREARDVMAFETTMARASWDDARRVPGAEQGTSSESLAAFAPGLPWETFLEAAAAPSDAHIVLAEPGAIKALARVYAQASMPTLRAWMTVHALDRAAPFLSTSLVDAWQEFHGRALGGQAVPPPAWQRAVRAVAGMRCVGSGAPSSDCFGSLRWAAGDLYLSRYFPAEAREGAGKMIDALRAAFRRRLGSEPWMSPATPNAALQKLDAYTVKIGGPTVPADLSGLTLTTVDLVGDARAIAALEWGAQLDQLSRPVDSHVWVEAPQSVDANNGDALDVEFPAGLFQPPVFDPRRDSAYNFGALGAFVGHEWTHAFDDTGRHIDAGNRRHDWWTGADDKAFRERASALSRQYDSFMPLPGVHVSGRQTLDEDIADLGGLSVALDAYHHSLDGQPAPVIDGLTGDQRVFLGWAWMWRGKKTQEALRRQLAEDVHAPFNVRVDAVVRNMDAWYGAFDVQAGDRLYLAPEARVRLW
jgi:putative endopeptidase